MIKETICFSLASCTHLELRHAYYSVNTLDAKSRQQILVMPLRILDNQANAAGLRVVQRVGQGNLVRLALLRWAQSLDGYVQVDGILRA